MPTRLRRRVSLLLLVAACAGPAPPVAAAADLAAQRDDFVAAERALRAGAWARFEALAEGLRDYPLHPYLEQAALERRLHAGGSRALAGAVEDFLQRAGHTVPGRRLLRTWLARLAREQRWQAFLEAWRPLDDTVLQCQHARALLETGYRAAAFEQVEPLWLSGRSQPDECDPVFAAWREAGELTPERVWARIRLAMDAGRLGLARYLARFLPAPEQDLAALWRRIGADPARVESAELRREPHARAEEILVWGLERLARRAPARAAAAWERLGAVRAFSETSAAAVQRRIGIAYAVDHDAAAMPFLAAVPDAHADETVHRWRLRAALRAGDWPGVLDAHARLPAAEASTERWRYWRARALEATGHADEARRALAPLARERSYHGFLAADRLGLPYRLGHLPLSVPPDVLARVEAAPGVLRAREFAALGRRVSARREWYHTIGALPGDELAAAALVAHRWEWHGVAILTVARSGRYDDLELRFPVAWHAEVQREAAARGLDPAWVLAVVRQESAFMADARSPRGALGLMQILPGTARQVARALGVRYGGTATLVDPATNLRFGTAYLRSLRDRFAGHAALASAAYNAGPRRVDGWLPRAPLAAEIWVETVPFRETRRYLRRVLAYTAVYEARLGGTPARLADRLPPVPPAR